MSSHNHTQEAVQIDGSCEGLPMEERLTHREVFDGPRGLRTSQATIDDLPDGVLLEIFDFYLDDMSLHGIYSTDQWHTLVHVCRWWRSVVFTSPRRLDLRLLCTRDRSVRAMLDIWPALPIQINYHPDWSRASEMRLNNIVAALEHPDRVRHISLIRFPGAWEALAAAMQVPLPELTYLRVVSLYEPYKSVLPSGSTPRLRTLHLSEIPFLAVRDLLLSVGDLVDLSLAHLCASPESMVACLSSLKRLESLKLEIGSRPDQPSPPPQARVVLAALVKFSFEGTSEYLEDFVARIDTPVLSQLCTALVGDLVPDIPHLRRFIGRARRLKPSKVAKVSFDSLSILLEYVPGSTLRIFRHRMDWGISSMTLVCGQLSPFFSLVERLDLVLTCSPFNLRGINTTESTLFLELFRPFTAIQGLYVSRSLIAPALQGLIGERATEVLPNLRDLFLGDLQYLDPSRKPFNHLSKHDGSPVDP
ncbi:hypothetical protein BC826DRAFT_1102793 [Russula brevipes]|nr:hypothetical protein BC826DRAFT_1102793 [Russula brevipes]